MPLNSLNCLRTDTTTTPRTAGFAPRAEWRLHARTWMGWPAHPETFVVSVREAQRAFAQVANTLSEFESVAVVCDPGQERIARKLLSSAIELLAWGLNDAWMRDIAPSFVVNVDEQLAGVDWQFNDYGNKDGRDIGGYGEDAVTAERILAHLSVRRFACPLVCEGGTLVLDGQGTLITTESVVLNPNRNPEISHAQAEAYFSDYLAADKVIWFRDGLIDDDTDGHTDNVVAFAGPARVLLLSENDPGDSNYQVLTDARRRLQNTTDGHGRCFEIVPVAQPAPRFRDKLRYALSYVNFCLANDGVLVPAFGDRVRDDRARAIISEQFPGRTAISVPSLAIVQGGGSLHCITHEEPLCGS